MKNKWRLPLALVTTLGVTTGMGMTAFAAGSSGTVTATLSSTTSTSSASTGSQSASTTAPVITQAEAVAAVTKVFSIPSGYTMQNAQLSPDNGVFGQPVYSISWQGPQSVGGGIGAYGPSFISATVSATTGTILQYNAMDGGTHWFDKPTITTDQGQSIAQGLLGKLIPDQSAQMKLIPNTSAGLQNNFAYTYVRMVNNIPAPFDSAQIVLGPNGGVVSYVSSWQKATFPSATATVSATSATSTYQSALGLHLEYSQKYSPLEGNSVFLSYAPQSSPQISINPVDTSGPWIDASTGAVVGTDGNPMPSTSNVTYTPLVPGGPTQFPQPLSTPLTAAQAESLASKELNIPSDATLTSASESQYSGPGSIAGSTWQLQYQTSTNAAFSVSVDANLGIVTSYNTFPMGPIPATSATPPSSTPITSTQAQTVAVNFVKKAFSSFAGAIALDANVPAIQGSGPNASYSENFVVLKNGIPVGSDIGVQVSQTGQISMMFVQPSIFEQTYPSATGAISQTQAEADYLKAAPLQLTYELPQTEANSQNGTTPQYGSSAILVYAPVWTNGTTLDAITGKWVNLSSQGSTPTDTAGSAGATDMNILAERGILPVTDGQVHPNAVVTRGEFVSWLVNSNGVTFGSNGPSTPDFTDVPSTNPYYSAIQQAVTQGWLTAGGTFGPSQPITRIQAAKYIVDWLGWNKLAANANLFAAPFSDKGQIPSNEIGDASIVSGFGIIPADNGAFLPNNDMNVSDASIAIIHALRAAYDN